MDDTTALATLLTQAKALRQQAGVTQEEAAHSLKISVSTWRRWETSRAAPGTQAHRAAALKYLRQLEKQAAK